MSKYSELHKLYPLLYKPPTDPIIKIYNYKKKHIILENL